MKHVARSLVACSALFGVMVLSAKPASAQQSPPTPQQAQQADNRQGQYLDANGARIFYQVAGSGTPLLLIHGFPLSGQLFEYQLKQLSSQFQVITPDLRGFGKSTTPSAHATDAIYAADMFALMDHLGIQKAIIGGHSMGGQITLEMYREQPDRFLGMLLIDTNAMAASYVEKSEWPDVGTQAAKAGVSSIVPIITPQMLTGYTRMNSAAKTNTMMDMLAEGSVQGIYGGAEALVTRMDYTDLLKTVSVPALVLVGIDDPIYSYEISEMMKNALPNGQFVILPVAEHATPLERPYLENAAIAGWWAQQQ